MFPAITPGAASQSVVIHIMDSTTGLPEQAVEHDGPGISLWYWRPGSTITAITPAALATLDAAYSSGGIEHIDDGDYRLDIPNAAIVAGVPWVAVGGTLTDMIVVGIIIPLNLASVSDVNSQVADVLKTDTLGEPAQGAPPATASIEAKIAWLYKFLRNKVTEDGTTTKVYNDAGDTVDHKSTVSEAAGTVTRGEFVTGP